MIPLYTVILDQPHTVSKFDDKGRKISETTTIVKQTIRDLPLQTARMYMDTSEPGTCQMFKQEAQVISSKRRHQVSFGDVKSSRTVEPTDAVARKKPTARPANKISEAAKTGDLAAAINAGG